MSEDSFGGTYIARNDQDGLFYTIKFLNESDLIRCSENWPNLDHINILKFVAKRNQSR